MDQLEPMPQDWTRALAIAAHPDDLEYGVSGAVAGWTAAGKDVRYTLVTRGEAGIDTIPPAECGPLREAEQRAACAEVGVSELEFLGHADGVVEYGLALRRDLAAAIRRHTPDLVITANFHDTWPGGGWNSPDHRNVGRAVMDAIGDAGNRWIFPELVAEGLAPWGGVRYVAVGGSPQATHAVDITDTLDRAVASLDAHHAYLAGLGDNPMADTRAFLEWMADLNAPRFGGRRAAAFELYRM
ncbi:PIG-L deacetylase family protein [Catellatospora citrea]|uniref:GlcNAc-PI de-N-acetylase n=1 Tax=Catellatospora citrea TaxID=53366 RepID=A0A8J3KTT5_9ACTN|nr:PIG-L deacetylase family protein [Catellatospora citrea]RKE06521.1 LmbE family N-acetylglucosaminyl deacetylase [Catellatospora citrea]GIG01825.1 GlcNAc-PI de-N-acetylase [Catellatospora citrea]